VLAQLVTTVTPSGRRALYSAVWHGRRLLAREIDALPPEQLSAAVQQAFAAARPVFVRLRDWGEAHRLRLAHPLGALPADGNRLVLLGGQDGVPGSPAFLDQAELFRRGEYVTVPLDPAAARASFPHRTVLEPARR
jgi:penicillin amidase